ncbi:hypothetical protein ACGFMM_24120 [Streptomyces sp. NPDC048604]|uniref:hypothetical protein n=1 Tax=Streptomyces sp. NPDC048604 TaxID=3365578 RepID=UPI00371F4A0D
MTTPLELSILILLRLIDARSTVFRTAIASAPDLDVQSSPWPHEPADVEYHATKGHSWRLSLSAADAHPPVSPSPPTTMSLKCLTETLAESPGLQAGDECTSGLL